MIITSYSFLQDDIISATAAGQIGVGVSFISNQLGQMDECVTCVCQVLPPGALSQKQVLQVRVASLITFDKLSPLIFSGFRCIRCFLCWNARASDVVARVAVIQHMNWHWYECR
jgi:hypothetical protein